MRISKVYLAVIIVCLNCFQYGYSQCTVSINSFPYTEGFESNDGGWTAGGTSSDWAWGTPTKTIINSAGGGNKCWITGGLTTNFYNYGEVSYLQSPVFDISSLQNPYISFKAFWETESGWDGASLQYSTDCGNSWINLGDVNDVKNCPGSNWFNTSSSHLNGGQGWSGSKSDGKGSSTWVTAFHSLNNVKGATSIMFRFTFNAGTTQNNYDGFAVDDIYVGEAPPTIADFNYSCKPNNAVGFSNTSTGSCINTFSWDFGDPASGASNTNITSSPTHTFSSAGTYTVTFIADTSIVTKTITILKVTATSTNVSCFGVHDGSATATATPTSIIPNYSWINLIPDPQTPTVNNLATGIYYVKVTAANACPDSVQIIITEPAPLWATITTTKPICGNNKGSINAIASGGTSPYSYLWNTNPTQTTTNINNLSSGTYSLHLSDNNNCYKDFTVDVADSTTPIHLFLGNDTTICPGQQLVLKAGNFTTYTWQDGSTNSTYSVINTGDYWVKVIDSNGCTASDSVQVTVECNNIYFPSAFTPNGDGLNDEFGPWGSLSLLKNYSITIYGRWGEIVFHSTNPFEKWTGKLNGKNFDTGTFVWMASYTFNGITENRKGTVVILR